MQAKLQSKITLFLIKPIYELSETMDIRGPKWALKKNMTPRKNATPKHATPLGAKPPLSLNPRNAPAVHYKSTYSMLSCHARSLHNLAKSGVEGIYACLSPA